MKLRAAFAASMMLVLAQASGCETGSVVAVKEYCGKYNRIVLTREERDEIRKLSKTLRSRIQGNDVDYLCNCIGWTDPVCKKRS